MPLPTTLSEEETKPAPSSPTAPLLAGAAHSHLRTCSSGHGPSWRSLWWNRMNTKARVVISAARLLPRPVLIAPALAAHLPSFPEHGSQSLARAQ